MSHHMAPWLRRSLHSMAGTVVKPERTRTLHTWDLHFLTLPLWEPLLGRRDNGPKSGIRGGGLISGVGQETALLTAVLYEVPSSARHLEVHYSVQSSKRPFTNSTRGLAFLQRETGLGGGEGWYRTCYTAIKRQSQALHLVLPSSRVYVFNHNIFALAQVVELRPVPSIQPRWWFPSCLSLEFSRRQKCDHIQRNSSGNTDCSCYKRNGSLLVGI